ncbi:hypothetical protein M5689_009791 [Euphorbia peplus]|nr:hypothetical protein M5689_009791 [Euphorbia peplus]
MTSEIVEVKDEEAGCSFITTEADKDRIRSIIMYQKSLYWSSSSSSSLSSTLAASVSASSPSVSSKSCRSLLELMRGGDTSLRRLFDMEHTSLATHFQDYSCSPITKTIPLWGSETDNDNDMADPWDGIKQTRTLHSYLNNGASNFASSGASHVKPESELKNKRIRISRQNLPRKRAFRRLPGFCFWGGRRFRLGLRLKRLRVLFRDERIKD